MKNNIFELIGELCKRLTSIYNGFGNNVRIDTSYNSGKDYWTMNLEFQYGNSKYSDCVILYLDEDNFDKDEILKDLDKIIKKAELLLQ